MIWAISFVKTFVKASVAAVIIIFSSASAFGSQCSISTTGINFGSYDILSAAPTDSTGSISISCNGNVSTVAISIGASSVSGSFQPRDMRSGLSPSYLLSYNLYTDSSRSVIWGDGTLGTQTVIISPVKRNTTYNQIIYGRIPTSQDVYYGPYSDTLTVTVTW